MIINNSVTLTGTVTTEPFYYRFPDGDVFLSFMMKTTHHVIADIGMKDVVDTHHIFSATKDTEALIKRFVSKGTEIVIQGWLRGTCTKPGPVMSSVQLRDIIYSHKIIYNEKC